MPSLVTVSSMLELDNAAPDQLGDVEDSVSVAADQLEDVGDSVSVATESSEEEGRLLVDIEETSSTTSSSDSPPPTPPPQRRPRLRVRLEAQDWATWNSNNK